MRILSTPNLNNFCSFKMPHLIRRASIKHHVLRGNFNFGQIQDFTAIFGFFCLSQKLGLCVC